ncbi:MAG: VOC family protein [Vicinamibacterales bacterium]
MAAPVVRWQIVSPHPDEVVRFYGAVFGWEERRDNALGYRALLAGSGVPGGVWPAPAGAATFVQLFIEVDDIAAAIEATLAHGGSVVVPRSVLPDGDVMAVVRDPLGTSVGLVTPVSRDAASSS